jgi:hypothetical protein
VSLLSKYVIQWHGSHIFNPSNIGLVICFIALGRDRAEPLDFWWGPMSWWLALALVIILVGGFTILSRLKLLVVALSFWAAFAAGIGVLAATDHAMTARWHLGPIHGAYFWWVLVTSPEVLVFLFFMITDPRTAPRGRGPRAAYAVAVGMVASVLIAPMQTEYATKVALLGALAIVCAAQPLVRLVPLRTTRRTFALGGVVAAGFCAVALVTVGSHARLSNASAAPLRTGALPTIDILPSHGVQGTLEVNTARRIAAALIAHVPAARHDRVRMWLVAGVGQQPPRAKAQLGGRTYMLEQDAGVWTLGPRASQHVRHMVATSFDGVRLVDVARQAGLDFTQDAFRLGMSNEVHGMMGGGLCWLDYNGDGWLDLFAVNSYTDANAQGWTARGGLPRSALFENARGHFVDVSARARANVAVQGNGCVAADFNGDGYTDLLLTTNTYNVLLWNNGNGTFTNGTHAAGIDAFGTYGWHTGAAVADVNGDGQPDVFVSGYADVNAPSRSSGGFPVNFQAFRDLLYLNEGPDLRGRSRFSEVGLKAGIERTQVDHGLGAVFTDVTGDGRPDLYVANDLDPNRLYVNRPGGSLGFHFVEEGRALGIADRNAGMGLAAQDYSGDGRPDLFVTNSRGQGHAAFRTKGRLFANARDVFAGALGKSGTGWGDSWVDLANNGRQDIVLANGAIPITNLKKDAAPIQVLENLGEGRFADASAAVGLHPGPLVNGRGLAAADYDNDGHVDIAINSIGGRLILLHNTGASGSWLEVKLARFAPAAVVTAVLPDGRRLVREVQAGSSYLSSEDPRMHFGLGAATTVKELTIHWPGGNSSRLTDVAANRILTVKP